MSDPYDGQSNDPNIPAISGKNTAAGVGVFGESTGFEGVRGIGHSPDHAGVAGINDGGSVGVFGESTASEGVRGVSHSPDHGGVVGINVGGGDGVFGESNTFEGVRGVGHSPGHGAVVGTNDGGGPGVFGKGNPAGFFDGDVVVTGDIKLTGADFAEEFDIQQTTGVECGTVMVLDQEGALRPSQQAYDKRVAGVISGAGSYKPGIVLDKQQPSENRMPVALVGKVYCKVDAHYASIEVGDLLTTSNTPGHAMKVDDPHKAFGSVIGKALRPLKAGQGLIPIMVALQ